MLEVPPFGTPVHRAQQCHYPTRSLPVPSGFWSRRFRFRSHTPSSKVTALSFQRSCKRFSTFFFRTSRRLGKRRKVDDNRDRSGVSYPVIFARPDVLGDDVGTDGTTHSGRRTPGLRRWVTRGSRGPWSPGRSYRGSGRDPERKREGKNRQEDIPSALP